jgi:hypothetical protein
LSGDRILIDTSQRLPVLPGIFAIWDGMGLLAKRIEHEPNSDPAMVVRIAARERLKQTYKKISEGKRKPPQRTRSQQECTAIAAHIAILEKSGLDAQNLKDQLAAECR